ncbi:UbiD family decarboxylase [Desulfitobacterium sp. AusDCA]|uniref:UbiD family decarboxylase n=1 Tax=Desulfitobacterium sp. AusDCA TaxID=3240383 RepID=UPI003DA6E6A9
MPVKDLREWMEKVEAMGELQEVNEANWETEIGAITDLYQQKPGSPALLFDKIPGYPEGHRVLSNSCMSLKRVAFSLELPLDLNPMELVKAWQQKEKNMKPIAPREVTKGPLLENVRVGKDVNLLDFPIPKWHEQDGGRFIGTACLVVMKDPDTGWVNFGAYRVQSDEKDWAILRMSPGRDGIYIRDKYWKQGKPCPVAVVVGQDPLLYMVSGIEVPHGVSEYDYAGGIRGEAYDVVPGPITGIPLPATAELAFEGEMYEGENAPEGPFGEWTGYYAGGVAPEPVIRIKSILHRNNPIILGSAPAIPPSDTTFYRTPMRSAMIWNQLEGAGVAGVKGVWAHELGGGRLFTVVSIEQLHPGSARQAGLVAANCQANAYCGRITIVVDEDIDVTDLNKVLWAVVTRCDPAQDLEIIRRAWSTRLDPLAYPEDRRQLNNRLVIDACIPFEKRKTFPAVATTSPELKAQMMKKWADIFPVKTCK